MLPLVIHLYVLALISAMTLNCHIHSCNDDDDGDDGIVQFGVCAPICTKTSSICCSSQGSPNFAIDEDVH